MHKTRGNMRPLDLFCVFLAWEGGGKGPLLSVSNQAPEQLKCYMYQHLKKRPTPSHAARRTRYKYRAARFGPC